MMNLKFREWMTAATTAEKAELAAAVDTSAVYLYQLSSGHREASPELARRIEIKTKAMSRRTKGRLATVWRVQMSTPCSQCEFARTCMASMKNKK